ncbi:MAG: hypothetical protein ACOYOT_07010 [Bacteroidales bacterium]
MKKIILLLTFCASAVWANATIYTDELINGSVGALSNAGWTIAGTAGTGGYTISSGALTYTDGTNTVANSGLGNTLVDNVTGTMVDYKAYKAFNGGTSVSSGVLYVSFLFKANANIVSTNQELLGLADGTSAGPKVLIGKTTTGFLKIGTVRGSSASADYKYATSPTSLTVGTTYFIVLKYDLTAGVLTSSVYINPAIAGTEPASPEVSDNVSATTRTKLSNLWIRQNGTATTNSSISGIRVADTWAEAVAKYVSPATPLATATGISTTATSNNDFSTSWTAVPNALSYIVKTYIGGTNLVNTTNVASGTSTTVSGLMSGLDYTYKVTAVGDGTTYSNSESSATSVSTTGKVSTISTDFSDGNWGTVAVSTPASGTYGNLAINGYDLTSTIVYTGSKTGQKGETHTNRLALDKSANGGAVILPTLNSVEQIEVHATFGSQPTAGTPKTFALEEYNTSTNAWSVVETYSQTDLTWTSSGDVIFITNISRASAVKLRIANKTSSGLYICQIIARTTAPALLVIPTVGTESAHTATTATANWTAVTGATSYTVKVYLQKHNGEGAIVSTSLKFTGSASGESASSIAVTGLQADSTYNYTVQAIGDGDVNYSTSFISSASANFVTAHQLAVPVTGSVSNNTDGTFTASWTAVANATGGYNVKVYEDAVYLKTVSVSGQATESADVSGLVDYVSHMYSYSVTAIGDNSTYFDSSESGQTAQFGITTLINNRLAQPIIAIKDNSLTINASGILSLFSLSGKEITKLNVKSNAPIRLNPGLYIVSFVNNNGFSLTKKISIR